MYGCPAIFNTDQGSQFTGADFTGMLKNHGLAVSMDGRGAWRDNVMVERFWRSIKYEEVYLRAYDSAEEAEHFIGRYISFCDEQRPHSSLDGRTPSEVYFTSRCGRRHNLGGYHISAGCWLFKKTDPHLFCRGQQHPL